MHEPVPSFLDCTRRGAWSGLPLELEYRIMPEPNSGCWLWIGGLTTNGYGKITHARKRFAVHRVVYKLTRGDINPALEIDHLCRNRCCCNPQHLELVTSRINLLRGDGVGGKNYRKTRCKNGHELIAPNIYPNSRKRRCIICSRVGNAMRNKKARAK
jgi:hypothetical protein